MPNFRRVYLPGRTYFFTLVTNQRVPLFQDEFARDLLRQAFRFGVQKAGSFQMGAICLLPDHLHCIWTQPENDPDYSTRWKAIKSSFSRAYLKSIQESVPVTQSKRQKGEAGIWQRRFWEHLIRDREDLDRHLDYIHYNPVKHGLVRVVKEWPWSSFHRFVQAGYYDLDWGCDRDLGDTRLEPE